MSSIQTDSADAQVSMVAGLTVHWHTDLAEIDAEQWDDLVVGVDGGGPFLRLAFLRAMVDSGSACPDTGWHPLLLTVRDAQGQLLAGSPLFVKDHSYGEYVFDWAWADAHDRALASQGAHYYPKLLSAVPFSPIPGQRLLVRPDVPADLQMALHTQLLNAITAQCEAQGWSSAHALFVSETEAQQAERAGWLRRSGVQFHWENREEVPYGDFEDFLASLQRDKRKKIQQERRKVREAGIEFVIRQGAELTQDDWDFFYRCYAQTYLERGRQPYLTRDFWQRVSQALPEHWVLFTAMQGGTPVASALLAIDPVRRVAYGRYWGAVAQVSCLHFEACYYQPLAWCIAQGYRRFEGGAQGEHKLARGLMPVATQSVHWLAHPGLRDAVARFLDRESQGIGQYLEHLDARAPFKISSNVPERNEVQ
jgi:predicted N-acyltransferase